MSEREIKIDTMLNNRLQSLTLVAEATYLRHNLSAILRSAEAFGVYEIFLISNRKNKIGGAAKGAEKWVKMNIFNNTEQCLVSLKEKGYSIWVADLHPEAKTPDTIPIDKPIAIVMGTELAGVSKEAKELADGFVTIPMQGLTQSLNVSVASACLLYRLSTRIRENHGGGDLSPHKKKQFKEELVQKEREQKESRRLRKELAKKEQKNS